MPSLSESRGTTKVMMVPSTALESSDQDGNLKVIKLKHPKTASPAMYLFNAERKSLMEIMAFKEDHRSWFIGEKIVSNGELLMATPVDPMFLILPYLIASDKLVPMDHLLTDPDYPHVDLLTGLTGTLNRVANQTGDPELNVWKYSEEKCIDYLESRVTRVKETIEKQEIDLSKGAAALTYKAAEGPSDVEYMRYAFGIVSQYLSGDLEEKLKQRLNLPEPEKSNTGTKRMSEGGEMPPGKKSKGAVGGPTEDYSKNGSKMVEKEPEMSKQKKALAKSAEGTKNIMSFFKKK